MNWISWGARIERFHRGRQTGLLHPASVARIPCARVV